MRQKTTRMLLGVRVRVYVYVNQQHPDDGDTSTTQAQHTFDDARGLIGTEI